MAQVRFGVSLDEEVLKELDQFVLDNHLPNRSQAIRHLVENRIVEKKWKENDVVSGAIVLLFDHHKGDVGVKMNDIQHEFYKEILSVSYLNVFSFIFFSCNCFYYVANICNIGNITK